jgi:HCOMODA/2-hydroxy-3-carboxy-muconic semialdehyde decarboxylase
VNRGAFVAGTLAMAAVASPRVRAAAADTPAGVIDDLVTANHVLAHENVVDGFGHISVRDPSDAARYRLARSMAPALVTAADILTYDLDSNALDANGRTSYAERFIHGAIYKARPDVNAIVHAHTPAVIPFGAVPAVRLQPVFHMGAFLGAGVPVFEIRDAGGAATDMLVSSQPLGDALARTLGSANVALMRGHGMVAVASTIPEAVFRAYYTGQDAQLQADAMRLGNPTYLSAEEARHATQTQAGLVSRAWDLWKRALAPK